MNLQARTLTHQFKGWVQIGYTYYTPIALSLILERSASIRIGISRLFDDVQTPDQIEIPLSCVEEELSNDLINCKSTVRKRGIQLLTGSELQKELFI
jgi:hypothetical protein